MKARKIAKKFCEINVRPQNISVLLAHYTFTKIQLRICCVHYFALLSSIFLCCLDFRKETIMYIIRCTYNANNMETGLSLIYIYMSEYNSHVLCR